MTMKLRGWVCAAALVAGAGTAGLAGTAPATPTDRLQLAQATPSAQTLPGGASALNETYRDWIVSCAVQNGARVCAASQAQTQQNSGQRVLAIEITTPSQGAATGTLVLPFGLALDAGVTLQVDDRPATKPLRFRTCLPAGCTVPLAFDPAMLTALRAGTTLKVRAVAAADGAEALLPISLQGLAPALDRLTAIAK